MSLIFLKVLGEYTNLLEILTHLDHGIKYKFCDKDIEGKIIKIIPNLGDILRFWTTPVGFVFFMLIIVCLIIMLRVIFIDCFNDKKGNIDGYNRQQN